jgi:hypothetical protein
MVLEEHGIHFTETTQEKPKGPQSQGCRKNLNVWFLTKAKTNPIEDHWRIQCIPSKTISKQYNPKKIIQKSSNIWIRNTETREYNRVLWSLPIPQIWWKIHRNKSWSSGASTGPNGVKISDSQGLCYVETGHVNRICLNNMFTRLFLDWFMKSTCRKYSFAL